MCFDGEVLISFPTDGSTSAQRNKLKRSFFAFQELQVGVI
jgi:hypothetical protein